MAFESGLTTAQIGDDDAIGGPRTLSIQRFHVGINDTLGGDPTGSLFGPDAMGLFPGWKGADALDHSRRALARASIARGEALFNDRPLTITGVGGLNDALGQPSNPAAAAPATTRRTSPDIGPALAPFPMTEAPLRGGHYS